MATLSEADVEAILLGQLQGLGYACLIDPATSNPDGPAPERGAYSDVVLEARFRAAIARLNPDIPPEAREDAIRKITASERPTLIEEDRRLHRHLVEGVAVEFRGAGGTIRGDTVRLLDPEDRQNDWLAISHFTVIGGGNNRRPDVVVFLNGGCDSYNMLVPLSGCDTELFEQYELPLTLSLALSVCLSDLCVSLSRALSLPVSCSFTFTLWRWWNCVCGRWVRVCVGRGVCAG